MPGSWTPVARTVEREPDTREVPVGIYSTIHGGFTNLTKISTRTGHARNRNAKDTETKPISTSDDDSNLNLGHSSVVHTGGSNLLRGSRNLRTHVRTHPCLVTTLD